MSPAAEKLAAAVALTVLMRSSFVVVGNVVGAELQVAPPWLVTSLDARLPVVAAAVWPYLSWYPAALVFLFLPRRPFRHAALAIAVAYGVCVVGYLLWPVSIARPAPAGNGLSARALALLYANDPPWNIFPSFHAALCAIMCAAPFARRAARRVIAAWMAAICVSCVLTKQHYVLDVVAGLAVGLAAFRAAGASVVVASASLSRARAGASVHAEARGTHE